MFKANSYTLPWERTLNDKVKWDRDEQLKWLDKYKKAR